MASCCSDCSSFLFHTCRMTFSTGIWSLNSAFEDPALVTLEQHTISTDSRGKKKKNLRLKIYHLSNHHFMNYSCKQCSLTDTGDEVWACGRKHTTFLTFKRKRWSHEFFHEWRSQITIKKSISYITITTNI